MDLFDITWVSLRRILLGRVYDRQRRKNIYRVTFSCTPLTVDRRSVHPRCWSIAGYCIPLLKTCPYVSGNDESGYQREQGAQ